MLLAGAKADVTAATSPEMLCHMSVLQRLAASCPGFLYPLSPPQPQPCLQDWCGPRCGTRRACVRPPTQWALPSRPSHRATASLISREPPPLPPAPWSHMPPPPGRSLAPALHPAQPGLQGIRS